jgi:thiol-disulfide isomerase/thioredoxin
MPRLLWLAALALAFAPVLPAAGAQPHKAPDWHLKDPDGNDFSSDQFKGKVVVLDFWATWCPPCVKEMPGLAALQKKYGSDGLVVVGVSVDEAGAGTVQRFLDKHDQIPTTVVIDRDGFIRERVVGFESQERLEKRLQPYLRG